LVAARPKLLLAITAARVVPYAVADVVQIGDECPYSRWKLGILEKLATGRNGRTTPPTSVVTYKV